MYYLHRVWVAQSGSATAAITSSREGPQESDLPAAAARSSLLSAPITGASVPTKTNSVVQPSEQPLPLPELLPSSPAATKSHALINLFRSACKSFIHKPNSKKTLCKIYVKRFAMISKPLFHNRTLRIYQRPGSCASGSFSYMASALDGSALTCTFGCELY